MSKVLFILKRREDYNATLHSAIGMSTGLYNSASFMNAMLNENGVDSTLVVVTDNNDIDREVRKHNPTHVIIEALWVVPTKFTVLKKLHPNVTWVIRVHSEMPFMAGEGMAMDWLGDYSATKNVVIAMNAPRMLREVRMFLQHKNQWSDEVANKKVIYLPNYYPHGHVTKKIDKTKDTIDIGCFGAVRPLKNHLVQAFAAIDFANQIGKKLRFHVNAGRIEMQGGPVLNNLRSLFEHIYDHGHEMINHEWAPREQFLDVCAQMDIGLQVSFSETFNIVGADLLSQGVPLVGSTEIPFCAWPFCANPTESEDIVRKLKLAYYFPEINVAVNNWLLTRYTNKTACIWTKYFK